MFFAILAKEIIEKKLCPKITYKYSNNRKNNKCNKIPERSQEGPRNVRVHLTKLLSLVPLFSRNNNQTRRGLGRVDVVPLGKWNF